MPSRDFPMVSIIILNFNTLEVTCEFIESTKKLTYPNYEIILVDNASTENPTEIISNNYPDVRLIVNKTNLGFAGGNNVGIKAAKGDFFFIVNNDTEVTPDLLEQLLKPFDSDPKVGIVSPKIRFHSNPEVIQYAGFTEINPFTGRNRLIGLGETDRGQYDKAGPTAYTHGAAMLVKKEVVEAVGLMPDHFFLYYEELDWSAHIRREGFKIHYQPSALIYHKESMSVGKESVLKAYFQNRNRILFMRRNSTALQFFCFMLFFAIIIVPKTVLIYLYNRQFHHLKNFFWAIYWNFSHSRYQGSTERIPQLIPHLR